MSPDHDEPIEDQDPYDEEPPRSIFSATWFRVVLVVIALGVVGAVAVPYVMEWMSPAPPKPAAAAKAPAAPPPPAMVPSAPPAAPPAPAPVAAAPAAAPAATAPAATAPAAPPAPPPGATAEKKAPSAPAAPPVRAEATTPKAEAPKPAARSETRAPARARAAGDEAAASSAKDEEKKPARRAAARTASTRRAETASGPWWVQVGAFKDPDAAKRLAARLRELNYNVEESTTASGASAPAAPVPAPRPAGTPRAAETAPAATGSDKYDVYISGMPLPEIDKRLTAKGLAGEVSGSGVVIRPSLPLRDAVALSKDLAVEGLKVQVRRAGGAEPSAPAATAPAPPPPPPAPAPEAAAAGPTLHRVRVGAFLDRAAATAAQRELEAKGFKGFLARGDR